MKQKHYVFLLFLFLLLHVNATTHPSISSTRSNSRSITYVYDIQGGTPVVFVYKEPEKNEVNLGEWFKISIIIANLGNTTAYDLIVQDEDYPEWTIETQNYSARYYIPSLDPNVTIYIHYRIRIIRSAQKNVSLGKTIVTYHDVNNNSYTAISKESFIIVRLRTIYINTQKMQKTLLEGATIITVLPLVGLIIIERKTLREYLSKSKKKR